MSAPTKADVKMPKWYKELSDQQMKTFTVVSDLLEMGIQGNVKKVKLYNVLKDLDLDITSEDISSVIVDSHKGAHEEINFDDFLFALSEPERLDSVSILDTKVTYTPRQRTLFTAITMFAIKNSLYEVESYYVKRIRGPRHVGQIQAHDDNCTGFSYRHLAKLYKDMQEAGKNQTSPYAQPLPFVTLKPPDYDEKQSVRRTESDEVSEIEKVLCRMADGGCVIAKLPMVHLVPAIRKKIAMLHFHGKFTKPRGWIVPWVQHNEVMPIIKIHQGDDFTFENVPLLRRKVSEAMDKYHASLRSRQIQVAKKHLGTLPTSLIRSDEMRENFKRCYKTYTAPSYPGPSITLRPATAEFDTTLN